MKTTYSVEVVIDGRTITISSENPNTLHNTLIHLSCSCYAAGRYNCNEGYVNTAEQDSIDADNLRRAAAEMEEAMDL